MPTPPGHRVARGHAYQGREVWHHRTQVGEPSRELYEVILVHGKGFQCRNRARPVPLRTRYGQQRGQ